VFIINYDEWGGFFDHVIPPRAEADDSVVPGSQFDFHLRGFRVPCIVISPFAPATVAHQGPFDHASVLNMVEWRFGLHPLAARDAAARNLAEVLDLTSPPRTDNPDIPVLVGQPRVPCGPTSETGNPPQPVSLGPGVPEPRTPPGNPPGPAADPSTQPTTGARLPRTGLDLPVEWVGGGMLLGAWSLYHLSRTGRDEPLPLLETPPETDPDAPPHPTPDANVGCEAAR
jgi:hypothetical protein